jgi:hypothetical protein
VFLVLTLVAFSTSLQPVRTPLLLNRPQTEEWKGWMQVRHAAGRGAGDNCGGRLPSATRSPLAG